MDLNYTDEEIAFREQVRAWLKTCVPQALRDKVARFEPLSKDDVMGWHRVLARKGWVAPSWPEEHGGTGWSIVQRHIFEEECYYADAPILPGLALVMCAPVLIRYGTPEQKQRFLPRIFNGDDFWCQGYSEPEAGSDLASLRTRAVRDGDAYVVTGQKTWTTQAHWADWIFCLVRTNPNGRPQEGISFLLIDMKSPGVTVRPLILMDGEHEVNEVFFEGVRVPAENLVHGENQGWTVAKFLLGHERLNSGRVAASKHQLARLRAFAGQRGSGGRCLLDDPRFRDRLTRTTVELMALEITHLRYLDRMRRTGLPPGSEVSLLKTVGSHIQQEIAELTLEAAGPLGWRRRPLDKDGFDELTSLLSRLAPRYFNLRKTTIYGGSDEIQRNVLAKMNLGF